MQTPSHTPTRLVSLDAFRGLTMAGMVIVNNPGDWGHVYPPLLHAPWHGWTPTDMVFPFFLFIVGVSMALSRSTMGSPWKILRRGLLIFAVGLFMAGWPRFPFATWRIPGVLQRIAVCYVAAAVLFRATASVQADGDARFRANAQRLLALAVALTLGYWALLTLVPVPGGSAGVLERGQDLGAYIDRTLLGGHLWSQAKTWDPEGILSTIPAIATTLLGLVAGLWLGSSASPDRKAAGMAVAGLGGILVGLAWSTVFPINKNLWTSSYVWFMGGAASLALSLCYWLIDVRGWRRWSWPFVVLGVNAITLFFASGMLAKWMGLRRVTLDDGTTTSLRGYVYQRYFVPLGDPYQASLLFALANLAVMFVLLYVMYRRRWFVKL